MKVLVVDDEQLARDRLSRLLENEMDYQVVGSLSNGVDAVEAVKSLHPDVVLMDIRMPAMDGLEAATHISNLEQPPAIVFCTAYDDYAIDAFEVNAVGYLLKPVRQQALLDVLSKAGKINRVQLSAIQDVMGQDNVANEDVRSHISARTRRGMELIPIESVCYFLADHKYVTVRHTEGEVLIDDTLKDLEKEFSNTFIRIHRNCLVSRHYLEAMERTDSGQYLVCLRAIDDQLQVSRRHVAQLRKLMQRL